jgi:hypothetical protein
VDKLLSIVDGLAQALSSINKEYYFNVYIVKCTVVLACFIPNAPSYAFYVGSIRIAYICKLVKILRVLSLFLMKERLLAGCTTSYSQYQ